MTIKDCIDKVDNIKPNQYTIKDKVMWLSFLEEIIINEVLKTHEGYDGRYDNFEGYSEDRLTVPLIVPSPYDRLYEEYLKMMIDKENGEIARYNNSMVSYNTYMMEYRKHYNKTHMPIDITAKRRDAMPPRKPSVGLSDAEYENLKRDMTYILTEYFSDAVAPDKLQDIVRSYMLTNIDIFKGKDGPKGDKGDKGESSPIDNALNPSSNNAISNKVVSTEFGRLKEQNEVIQSYVDGLITQIEREAHFRGYVSSNAKILTLNGTPNDFAYSAESGTKWIFDEVNGWQNSGTPVPDQLTPASDSTPLMNGKASPGVESSYARGDHKHPTDTTRASATEFNALKSGFEAEKVKVHEDNNSATGTINQVIEKNSAYYYGEVTNSIYVAFDDMGNGFSAALYFTTPSTIPASYSRFSDDIHFKGDSTADNKFVPEPNTRYTIVFDCDGTHIIAYVSGVAE